MRNRWPALVVMGALVVLAGVVARGSSAVPIGQSKPLFAWLRLPNFRLPQSNGDPEAWPPTHRAAGWWSIALERVILLLPLIVLAVVIVAAVVVSLRRRRLEAPMPVGSGEPGIGGGQDDQAAALMRAARAAAQVLAEHEGGEPGDAVIAAWLELERVAAQSGTGKQAHQTPTEFTEALVAENAAIQHAVGDLRKLYHRARFGPPGAVGQAEADGARRALDGITAAMVPR